MTASYYLMSADAFDRCRADPNGDHFPASTQGFNIDKAHDLFGAFFRDMPEPLNHAVEGELFPGNDLDESNDDATHVGYLSPGTVQTIAQFLEGIHFQDLLADAELMGWSELKHEVHRNYYESYWLTLCDAFRTAARERAALAILMC